MGVLVIPSFRRVRTDDQVLERLQDAVAQVLDQVTNKPHLDARLIEDIIITGSVAKTVEHKLGREYTGFIVCKQNAGVAVYQTTSAIPKKHIVLNASADVTVSILVF